MVEAGSGSFPPGFRPVRKLGAGRSSEVYLAESDRWGAVALKLMRAEAAVVPELRRLFENEVQITLGLRNPHVVAGYEGRPTGEAAFLALEYCPGGTLGELLARTGRLELADARRLVRGVASALEYLHGHRILHRDVKSANVYLAADGAAKLGDFGAAAYLGGAPKVGRAGTIFYMAPEIFEGAVADTRSDLYSLGVLAYEILSGQRPFTGNSHDDLMIAHTSHLPRSLAHRRPDIGKTEAQVVAKAMARSPDSRFRSVREFREAFESAHRDASSEPGGEGPEGGRPEGAGRGKRKRRGLFDWLWRKNDR